MTWNQIKLKIDAYERLMRLDKPIGTLLLAWPTLWALWISSRGQPFLDMLLIFLMGTVLMRSAGCVINDYFDRNFDGHVARTRHRPLATGEVSGREALVLAALLVLAAAGVAWTLHPTAKWWALGALFLAATYPLTKRFFALPQAYLGLAFGFGIPIAFAAQAGQVPALAGWLLLANVFWTLAYDTEYAMVDRSDDLKLGLKTSAITFGRLDVAAIMVCYALFLGILLAIGLRLGYRWPYHAGLGLAALLVGYQYTLIRARDPGRCFKAFLHNNWIGLAVFAGLVAEHWLRRGPPWRWWPLF